MGTPKSAPPDAPTNFEETFAIQQKETQVENQVIRVNSPHMDEEDVTSEKEIEQIIKENVILEEKIV